MPYCPKCGRFFYTGTRSCSTCGELLEGQMEKRRDAAGGYKTVNKQEKDRRCPYCQGTGKVEGPIEGELIVTCPVCRGRRYNLIPQYWLWCKECDGKGEYIFGNNAARFRNPCPECKGTGWVERYG